MRRNRTPPSRPPLHPCHLLIIHFIGRLLIFLRLSIPPDLLSSSSSSSGSSSCHHHLSPYTPHTTHPRTISCSLRVTPHTHPPSHPFHIPIDSSSSSHHHLFHRPPPHVPTSSSSPSSTSCISFSCTHASRLPHVLMSSPPPNRPPPHHAPSHPPHGIMSSFSS